MPRLPCCDCQVTGCCDPACLCALPASMWICSPSAKSMAAMLGTPPHFWLKPSLRPQRTRKRNPKQGRKGPQTSLTVGASSSLSGLQGYRLLRFKLPVCSAVLI